MPNYDPNSALQLRIIAIEYTLKEHEKKLAEVSNLLNGGLLIANENKQGLVELRDYLNEELKTLWEEIKPSQHDVDKPVISTQIKSFWDFWR